MVGVAVVVWVGVGVAAVVGVGVFLGFAASFYTLLLGYTAFTVTIIAGLASIARRSIAPLLRLAVIAAISLAIAAITWLPFLLRAVRGPLNDTGSAQHYLPADGAVLSFPMLQFSLLGALCMLGTLWLAWRARSPSSVRAGALGELDKVDALEEAARVIRGLHGGWPVLGTATWVGVAAEVPTWLAPGDSLGTREGVVLASLAEGGDWATAAGLAGIRAEAARNQVRNLLARGRATGYPDAAQAARGARLVGA